MNLRSLMTIALMATASFAQGPGGRRAASGTPPTPPTPAQLAARELQAAANFLHLDSAQTSALTGNTGLVSALTADEMTLQSNAATLKTDYGTLSTQLVSAPSVTPAELAAIQTLQNADLATRVQAAGQIIAALQTLSPALTTQQASNLPALAARLAAGGGAGRFGGRRP